MKVFISWSGDRSHRAAQLLKSWLKCVLQATEPWLSSDDIERGSIWFQDITNTLAGCGIGILCLTKENRNAPWILFEAGGLLKGLSTNRVCTFLADLEAKDIVPPLSQFNHTTATKESMFQLVSTLNNHLENMKLDDKTLEDVFETYWPKFEKEFQRILKDTETQVKDTEEAKRSEGDLLTEILYSVRSMNQRLNKLEKPMSAASPQNIFDPPWEDEPPALTPPPEFETGDLVQHKKFGTGNVVNIRRFGGSWLLDVKFDISGTKTLVYPTVKEKNLLEKIGPDF